MKHSKKSKELEEDGDGGIVFWGEHLCSVDEGEVVFHQFLVRLSVRQKVLTLSGVSNQNTLPLNP